MQPHCPYGGLHEFNHHLHVRQVIKYLHVITCVVPRNAASTQVNGCALRAPGREFMDTKELIGPEYVGGQWVITLASGEVLELRQGMEAPGRDFSGCDLRMMKLSGANLEDCRFKGANLSGADLSHARLRGARFAMCELNHAVFEHADATKAMFILPPGANHLNLARTVLTGAKFFGNGKDRRVAYVDMTGADLFGARFMYLQLDELKLTGANATGSRWLGTWIMDSDCTGADLVLAEFVDCAFEETDFTCARMDGIRFVDCRTSGFDVVFDGATLDRAVIESCEFGSGQYKPGIQAKGASFREATLLRSQFAATGLEGADFTGAMVVCCIFDGAVVERSRWANAQVTGSRFRGCEFHNATFDGAVVRDCGLQNALLGKAARTEAVFEGCDWGVSVPGIGEAA